MGGQGPQGSRPSPDLMTSMRAESTCDGGKAGKNGRVAHAEAHNPGQPFGPGLRVAMYRKTGAGEGIRTLDPNLGKVVLYP